MVEEVGEVMEEDTGLEVLEVEAMVVATGVVGTEGQVESSL